MKNIQQSPTRYFITGLFLFLLNSTAFCQKIPINVDSLNQIFQAAPDVAAKEAFLIENTPPSDNLQEDLVKSYGEWYHSLYKESGYKGHEVNAFFYEGLYNIISGLYPECVEKFEAALGIINNEVPKDARFDNVQPSYKIKFELTAAYSYTGKDFESIIKMLKNGLVEATEAKDIYYQASFNANLGSMYNRNGQTELIFSHLIEADRLFGLLPITNFNFPALFDNRVAIARTYQNQKNIKKAKYYFEQTHDLYEDPEKRALLFNTPIFIHLLSYGIFLRDEKEYDAALPLLQEALKISRNTRNKFLLGYGLYDLALLYINQKDFDKSKPLIEEFEAFELIKKSPELQTLSYEVRGMYERETGNYNRARISFLKVKEHYEKQKEKNRIADAYMTLSKVEKLANNPAKAYEYLEKSYEIKDSIYNKEILMNQEKLGVQYETSKKDKEIITLKTQELASQANLARQRNIIGASLFGLLFFGVLGFISFRNAQLIKRTNNALAKSNKALEDSNKLLDIKNQENELLLKEIHHRVKNNLEVVSSLLALQSRQLDDDSAKSAMQESQNRVQSMGIIHQKLYQGENLAAVEMKDYFVNLGEGVLDSFGKSEQVEITYAMEELELDVDTAVPIGLIVNELLTNALKYAFKEEENPEIQIKLERLTDNSLKLQVSDNGIGKTKNEVAKGTGFGSQLVQLLTDQLEGVMNYVADQGSHFSFHFKPNNT